MPIAIVGMGVPGSGKTTFLKAFAERHGLAYINKDAIRAELLGDVRDQSKNRKIWLESERRIASALAAGTDIVLDATYAERWKREELTASLRKRGATKVVGAYFDIPFERAQEQNRDPSREIIVPDRDMYWFHEQLVKEPPHEGEGFDVVFSHAELDQLDSEFT